MGWEQRNADFCKAQTDAQMAYIEAEREVDQLQDENAKLVMKLNAEHIVRQNMERENAKLRELVARLIRHIENPPCESCMAEMSCAGGEGLTNCDEYQFMVSDARELGVDA